MRPFLFLILILFVSQTSYAQNPENDVRINAYFQEANKAYEKSDFEKVVYYCDRVEELQGETNVDLEALRMKSYYKADEHKLAKLSLDKFFSFNPTQQQLLEIEPYIVKIEEAENYRKLKEEQEKLLQEKLERETYDQAIIGTPYDIKIYLSQYPEGEHYQELFDLLEKREEDLYGQIKESTDRDYIKDYYKYFSNGKYIEEVKKRGEEIEEYEFYLEVMEKNSEESFDNYLENYPDGIYVKEINAAYADYIFENGVRHLENKKYVAARNYFSFFESKFPEDRRIEQVKENHIRAQKGMKRDKRVSSRHRNSFYMMATYVSDKNIGLELGGMSSLNRVSVYWTLEGRDFIGALSKITELDKISPDEAELGEFKTLYLTSSLGLNIRLVYPVWLYVGGGVRAGFLEPKKGSFYYDENENDLYRLDNKDFIQVFPEVGVGVRVLRRVAVKAGFRFVGDTEYKVGIGIVL